MLICPESGGGGPVTATPAVAGTVATAPRRSPLGDPTFPEFAPTVPELLRYGADRYGEQRAVVTDDAALTYRQLHHRSRLLAIRLVAAGVGKGSRVAVLLPNSVEWIVIWAAVTRIGAILVPLSTTIRPGELTAQLRHADVQLVVTSASYARGNGVELLERAAPDLVGLGGSGPLYLQSLPQLRYVLLLGPSTKAWATGDLDLLASDGSSGSPPVLSAVAEGMEQDVTAADPMAMVSTSGSEGEPKGVVHTHGALIRHSCNLAAVTGLTADDRIWTPMPLSWVGGLVWALLRVLQVGATLITQAVFEPGRALALLERERVTQIVAWPRAVTSLQRHGAYSSTDLSSLRRGQLYDRLAPGDRPADPELMMTGLGMTETGGPHLMFTPAEEASGAPAELRGRFVAIGHPMPGTEHLVVYPGTSTPAPNGDTGELLVRGYNLMHGIHRRERADVFEANGWYRTGDLVFAHGDWLVFAGRRDDVIKSSGSNVSPLEVETRLIAFPEVGAAVVVGVGHAVRGQEVVAMVIPAPGMTERLDGSTLRSRLKGYLSPHKVPRAVFVVSDQDLPLLASQKIDRSAATLLAGRLLAELDCATRPNRQLPDPNAVGTTAHQ